MRIAVDARELEGKPTGVGRYLSEILGAWRHLPEAAAHEIVLVRPDASAGTAWEQFTLPGLVRRASADVLFAPAYTGPLRSRVPMVLTIHDVSFAAHPEWFGRREGVRRRLLTRLSAQRAERVITVSEFSKQEIVTHLGIRPGNIDVIYSGISSIGARTPPAGDGQPRVLFVGSVFNRRHVPDLIEGFALVARRHADVRLDIVGDNRTMPRLDLHALVEASGVEERIRLRFYIGDDELAALYRSARAFAFLSTYEGFGFTPLEALAAGVPIVVLDTPVAREIYGQAAIYVPSPEAVAIDRALERALYDDAERARVLAAAPAVLQRYAWTEAARRTLDVLVRSGLT